MLKSLHIHNFAIIEQLELEFYRGLTVLTGETGAGKSIIIDAIGLVLGDRADINTIRADKESAEITLVIDIVENTIVKLWLRKHDLEGGSECILRRVIRRDGKSRAYINNVPVPLKTLKDFSERVINIYGQHAHQALMHSTTQRELVDNFADNKELLAEIKCIYRDWCKHKEIYDQLIDNSSDMQSTVELLRYQIDELDQLNLQNNELEELDQKHKRLANAEALKQTTQQASHRLKNEEGNDVYSQLGMVCTEISQLTESDQQLEELNQSLEEAFSLVADCANELRGYAESIELNDEELTQIETRLETIDHIARKHKIKANEIAKTHKQLKDQLKELSKPEYDHESLAKILDDLQKDYQQVAGKISLRRKKASKKLSTEITEALANLGMNKAVVAIAVEQSKKDSLTTFGFDAIEFLVQTNPGQSPLPLAQIASGGELSRISLAIQLVAVDKLNVPVLIFDEVDAGVGGAVAEVVGKALRTISGHRQVMCITHLAQVAANAHHHYRVNKHSDQAETVSAIEHLDRTARITELARMLGGIKLTENTFLHAEEMLETNIQ